MLAYYPWLPSENRADDTTFLYEYVRNPLTHSLGPWQGLPFSVFAVKDRMEEGEIKQVEEATTRPNRVAPTIIREGTNVSVSVLTLYWGLFQVLRQIARDSSQLAYAADTLRKHNWQPQSLQPTETPISPESPLDSYLRRNTRRRRRLAPTT
jgi:hypothetical protein